MAQVKAFLIDMDGTILDSELAWRQSCVRLMCEKQLVIPEEIFHAMPDMRCFSGMKLLCSLKPEGLDMTYEECVQWAIDDMRRLYRTRLPLRKGAVRFLQALKDANIPAALVTMTPMEETMSVLDRHGITAFFQFVHSTHGQPENKGNPELFDHMATRFGVKAENLALLDDSLYALKGAKKAGTLALGIEDPVSFPDKYAIQFIADRYFREPDDVTNALPEILQIPG